MTGTTTKMKLVAGQVTRSTLKQATQKYSVGSIIHNLKIIK